MKYYDILFEDNQRKYAYYRFDIRWKVSEIASSSSANGYILQKVMCFNDSKIGGIETRPYYEAWLVENGRCVPALWCEYDDSFEWGCKGMIASQIKNSFGKFGSVIYRTQVYWIDRDNDKLLFEKIDLWEEGGVYAAGNLKSCYVTECSFLDSIQPVFKRPDFVHQIDFVDENTIEKALHDLKQEFKLDSKKFESLVYDILEGTSYEFLIDRVTLPMVNISCKTEQRYRTE